ncbi:MAG: phosphate acetyltransferase [Defluviitaleaceae bacterium]|nr:phosphate acetyltransferase [Defluviitaleaceae bacterium]
MSFLETIKDRARAAKKTIVLPESGDIRTLKAADAILKEGISKVILIGNVKEIKAASTGLDLSKAECIDPGDYSKTNELSEKLAELRKSKGMTQKEAEELLKTDPLYLGCMLVKENLADGMVAGAVYSTANVLRPSLQILKTAPGIKLVSSFFIMVVPDCDLGSGADGSKGVFLFSDCGLVQNPTADELAAIAQSSAESFRKLVNEEPKVAMLSHSTKGSAKHPDVDKVVEAVRIAKESAPHLMLDGELQLDAAIVPEIGKQKAPDSTVAGHANVLIFPDLDSGNIGYKLVQRMAKADAYGPITQGISKPVNDLSRGCSVDDIVGVTAITAVLV